MTGPDLLRWIAGAGWLVLGGGGNPENGETGDIDAAALGWSDLDCPISVLLTGGGSTEAGEAHLDAFADLGGPNGIIVPVYGAEDAHRIENCQLLSESGLICLADGPDAMGLAETLRGSPALGAIIQAFRGGATLLGMGAGAAVLGSWTTDSSGARRPEPGLALLHGAIIKANFGRAGSAKQLRQVLLDYPDCMGLGIPEGVALALGPGGRVETVGDGQVTVILSHVKDLPDP